MAKPIFPREKREYKSEWIENSDKAIKECVEQMTRQGWLLIAAEVSSSSPGKMCLKFRRNV